MLVPIHDPEVAQPGESSNIAADVVTALMECMVLCCWHAGMYVNRDFVGHGIGTQFHAAPAVLHHRNVRPGSMQLWQTFTIEPILAMGTWKQQPWPLDQTGWTCVTPDASLTAQFEHTIMVTSDGAEVLTKMQS
jgi:methionine aminopeptidase